MIRYDTIRTLARSIRVLCQIIVSSCSDTHQFLCSKGEGKGHIGTRSSVMGEAIPLVDVPSHQVFSQFANVHQKVPRSIDPFLVVFRPDIVARGNEIFDLHLFEFPRSENEISGRDFVSEGLAHLGNSKGDLLSGAVQDVLEVDEDSLCGFRS